MRELTIDELFATHAEEGLVEEATRYATVPTGPYTLVVEKYQAGVEDDSTRRDYGRVLARIQASVQGQDSDGRRGRVFFNVSPEERRDGSGRLDSAFRLYGMAIKATGLDAGASLGEVLEALTRTPVTAFISESYQQDGAGWVRIESDQQRKEVLEAGGQPKNFVLSLGRVKA